MPHRGYAPVLARLEPMPIDPRVRRSTEMYDRANQLFPGKTQLRSRLARGFAEGVSPVYAKSAKGSRFIDVDGNEYVDWVSAFGAIILGHADDVIDNAVKDQIDRGSIYTVNGPLEIELAEELVATIPSAEMVRYTKAGGEACALAVRIARAATGRDKVLFSGYHGWHDWYQAAQYESDPKLASGVEPVGVPRALAGTSIPFAEGDLRALRQLLDDNAGEVAAVMMEPLRSTVPEEGYLETVKELVRAHGAVLIFDEVSCGWRIALGGAQEYLGVIPDMTVVAKAMSNGYPMGAVVGSRESMEPGADAFISSSYWSDNIGLAASLTTIRELRRRESASGFKELGEKLTLAMNEAIESVGISAQFSGLHTNPTLTIDAPDETVASQAKTLFIQEMARRGVHCNMTFKGTLAHTDEDIKLTADATAESLAVVMKGLEGDMDELLVANVQQEAFRRIVR